MNPTSNKQIKKMFLTHCGGQCSLVTLIQLEASYFKYIVQTLSDCGLQICVS